MRILLRLFPALTIVSLVTGFGLLSVANNTGSDTSPFFVLSLLVIVVAFLFGLVTAIIGVVASATQRQFGWLAVLLVAGLVPLVGAIAISLVTPMLTPAQQAPPVGCKPPAGTPVPPGCQSPPASPNGFVSFLNGLDPVLFLAAPILVALAVFIYSFRLRESVAVTQMARR
jgi:hypothetical protein